MWPQNELTVRTIALVYPVHRGSVPRVIVFPVSYQSSRLLFMRSTILELKRAFEKGISLELFANMLFGLTV